MKIAITGHTNGIGKAFAEALLDRGHETVGISRSGGENIRRIAHTVKLIEPCDLFINNAQSYFAQTEILYELWKKWQGQTKWIWNISTQMTESPVDTKTEHNEIDISLYRIQKISLEEASRQLQHKNSLPKITIIRPGKVKDNEAGASNPKEWVENVVDIIANRHDFHVTELSLIHNKHNFKI